jgi:hypothetical protein
MIYLTLDVDRFLNRPSSPQESDCCDEEEVFIDEEQLENVRAAAERPANEGSSTMPPETWSASSASSARELEVQQETQRRILIRKPKLRGDRNPLGSCRRRDDRDSGHDDHEGR